MAEKELAELFECARDGQVKPGSDLTVEGAVQDYVARTGQLVAGFEPRLQHAAQVPADAEGVVFSLFVTEDPSAFHPDVDPALRSMVLALEQEEKLPLLLLCLPALATLEPAECRRVVETCESLAASDGCTTLFELAACRILRRQLAPRYGDVRPRLVINADLDNVLADCGVVLSSLARMGGADPELALTAGAMELGEPLELLPPDACRLAELEEAMANVETCCNHLKLRLLTACMAVVSADGVASDGEMALVRAIAAGIGYQLHLDCTPWL